MKSSLYEIILLSKSDVSGNDGLSNPVNNIGGQRNSREITLRKAKDSIRHLCAQARSMFRLTLCLAKERLLTSKKLRLKEYHIDESYRFYKLALNHNFTRGRKAEQVYASCVYLSCRTAQRPTEHMLLGILSLLFCIFFKITIIFQVDCHSFR